MPIIHNNTLSYVVNLVNRANSDVVSDAPLSHAAFTLDSSGVAGFFGGESAVRAMATVNLVPKRRWFGWYNAPGSYEVAKRYSGLAKSKMFDALFPGEESNPAKILMVDGQVGPEYTPLYSTSNTGPSPIGHLGSLMARKVSQMPVKNAHMLIKEDQESSPQKNNTADTCRVTFVRLRRIPTDQVDLLPSSSIIFAVGTILISVGGCIACALVADWFSLANIALGIIANGVACSVIGSGELYLKHNHPYQAHTPGDILLKSETDIIVLVGNEGSVSPFTRGRFGLYFRGMPGSIPKQVQRRYDGRDTQDPSMRKRKHEETWMKYLVDISVILLLSQFLAQLLLIPQGTLFGQLMFIGTLIPSWMYHSYLSSLSLDFQTEALFQKMSIQENADICQYHFNAWTQAVVFSCLVFKLIHPLAPGLLPTAEVNEVEKSSSLEEAEKVLEKAKKEEIIAKEVVENAKKAMEAAKKPVAVKPAVVEAAEEEARWAARKAKETKNAAVEAEKEAMEKEKAAQDAAKAPEEKEFAEAEKKALEAEKKVAEAAKKVMDEILKDATEKEKKSKDSKKAKDVQKEEKAFQMLLDALLPDKTDAWQAFKDSLVGKISKADINSYGEEEKPSFHFESKDRFIKDANVDKCVSDDELTQLHKYQAHAERALVLWKAVLPDITEKFGELINYYK